jgi:hypothetical protein
VLCGCVTGTKVAYSEYQYDRYGTTERTYERDFYSDPTNGIERERCRTIVRRQINNFGEEAARRDRVCDPLDQSYAERPWDDRTAPPSVYQSPVDPPLPPANVPGSFGTENSSLMRRSEKRLEDVVITLSEADHSNRERQYRICTPGSFQQA